MSFDVPAREWRPRAEALAAAVVATVPEAAGWRDVFADVPRHHFVPTILDDTGRPLGLSRDTWLDLVYTDDTLLTQTRPISDGRQWPTSSSTRPSLMARMLAALDLRAGESVLEVGTGTGYNAALLCRKIGDTAVSSLDLDPSLVATAGARLAELGHRPHLEAVDGRRGLPDRAPFTRIIATCAVAAVPADWCGQLSDGGILVADVRGDLESSLAILSRDEGRLAGHLTGWPGHFMPARDIADDPLPGGDPVLRLDKSEPRRAVFAVPTADLLDDSGFRYVLQFAVPDLLPPMEDESGRVGVLARDSSWAEVTGGVLFGGPRNLPGLIESAWKRWREAGCPPIDRLGLTIEVSGRNTLWADRPDNLVAVRYLVHPVLLGRRESSGSSRSSVIARSTAVCGTPTYGAAPAPTASPGSGLPGVRMTLFTTD
ncbi:protein-L-isoaspartate O-methyltransferase [Stackebrandtia endophytica]|uniref:Protein-L-isoaspartate O-methyltransferase n=1 Tax=Stackebrandtia endophytica TaxID=1496996 RepID=A0A543B046_9ACTN|nr:methyltransferase domain-containing protein [Stackebrandtia endophytica]TQL78212.1 protein-L-isoaspartate O-methyltransferase [Stackebrandtia endophytica]